MGLFVIIHLCRTFLADESYSVFFFRSLLAVIRSDFDPRFWRELCVFIHRRVFASNRYISDHLVYVDLHVLVSLSICCAQRKPDLSPRSIGSLRRNLGLMMLFFCLSTTFLLLGIGAMNGSAAVNKAGGVFGIVTALVAFYCGLSDLLVKEESWFTLPMGTIRR